MFVRKNSRYTQVAYVTNDIERAIAMFKSDYDVPSFLLMPTFDLEGTKPDDPKMRMALCNVNGVEVELIEPLSDPKGFYADVLPKDEFAVRPHHIAFYIQGPKSNWDQYLASLDTTKHPIAFQGGLGQDLRFIYTDERSRLGHYVEHIWLSEQLIARQGGAVPHYP